MERILFIADFSDEVDACSTIRVKDVTENPGNKCVVFAAPGMFNNSAVCTALKIVLNAALPYFTPGSFFIFSTPGAFRTEKRPACAAIKSAIRNEVRICYNFSCFRSHVINFYLL
ncbi:MAG TPA: hypothetical protein VK213_11565 [Bacteroidales bacterium]|nr:hypothetical protein [Bacteroidales bacterium]